MQIDFKIFSTRSGKSVILKIEEKTYAFNIFEGFQRYCIERRFSLCSIDHFFIANRNNIPAIVGVYLTTGDANKKELSLVTDTEINFANIFSFAPERKMQLNIKKEHTDKYVSVETFTVNGQNNYTVDIGKIRGRFRAQDVPRNIPKTLYKDLSLGKKVLFDGKEYDGGEFCDDEIKIKKICILISGTEAVPGVLEIEDLGTVICFDRQAATELSETGRYKVYYILENRGAEYLDYYGIQSELHRNNADYLLPVIGEEDEDSGDCLRTGDSLSFKNKSEFVIIKEEQVRFPKSAKNTHSVPSLLFLGTGCAIPSKLRNVSAILYESQKSAMLLDCGEDTLSQILRVYDGYEVLEKLSVIYLSHSHADHILGAVSVLWKIKSPVVVVGPKACRAFFYEYCSNIKEYHVTDGVKELERQFYNEYLKNETCAKKMMDDVIEASEKYTKSMQIGEFFIRICGVCHTKDSTGIRVDDLESGVSLSYSGDTVPSCLFSMISADVDVMVHESTFVAGQENQARKTMHTISGEADEVFRISRAKRLVKTHFSNRNVESCGDGVNASDFYRIRFVKRL